MKPAALSHATFVLFLGLSGINPSVANAAGAAATQCPSPIGKAAAFDIPPEHNLLEMIRSQQEAGSVPSAVSSRGAKAQVAPCPNISSEIVSTLSQAIQGQKSNPLQVTDQPDIFGSIALPVSHTPLDAKWRAARDGQLTRHAGPWAALIQSLSGVPGRSQIEAVNRWVNARVHFKSDRTGADHWSSAAETLNKQEGDCEDFAIAKLKLLEAAGFARTDLYFVIAHDVIRRADHAILVVRLDQHLFALDSSTDQILDARKDADYRPIFSYGSKGAWVHGTIERSVQIAAAI
jgi:predicted transglutaminase-like cysteine proteinase